MTGDSWNTISVDACKDGIYKLKETLCLSVLEIKVTGEYRIKIENNLIINILVILLYVSEFWNHSILVSELLYPSGHHCLLYYI